MIVIVGGGITGLSLARELDRLDADFVVLEARERPGGVIRSGVVDGRILDWGPQRTRLTPGIARLIEDLGLTDEVVTAPPGLGLWIYRGGRLRRVPMSVRAFLASDLVGPWARARLFLEPFTAGPDPGERVSTYFERKLGGELYETVVAPLYGGLYASDPADMEVGLSLIHTLREVGIGRSLLLGLLGRRGAVLPPACSFRLGMQTLPDVLAGRLADRLRLSAPVGGVRSQGAGWCVALQDGTSFDAEAVVLTTPAQVTAGFLEDAAPAAATAIASLRYNPLAVVHLDAVTDLEGMGFQVAFTEDELLLRGVTFNQNLFGRRNLYTAYLGGARHPEVAGMDREALAEVAAREFGICTGHECTVLSVAREHMPAWDMSWRAIHGLSLPPGLHLAANWWSRPGLPGRLAESSRVARRLAGTHVTSAPSVTG